MLIRSFLILFLTAPSLNAQGGIFGFHSSPCPEGGTYSSEFQHCFYCPEGAQPLNELFSKNKKCVGIPVLGDPCPRGRDVWFDAEGNICLYCPPGYVFSHNHKNCYQ